MRTAVLAVRRRLARGLVHVLYVLGFVLTVLFVLLRLSGDPVALLLPENATAGEIATMRRALGLDRPLAVQYAAFLGGMLTLRFGESLRYGEPALSLVLNRLPPTLELTGAAAALAVVVALPVGLWSALHRGKIRSVFLMGGALLGQSMPAFWLGLLLILIFAVQLRLLPSFGRGGITTLILPAVTLGAFMMAKLARLVRSGVLEVLSQDYIRTALAKGLPRGRTIWRHALRNALLPVVTVLGLDVGHLLGGAVIVETIFAWPGMGQLLVQSILASDYPVVQATVFLVTILVVTISLIVDAVYALLDPRIEAA